MKKQIARMALILLGVVLICMCSANAAKVPKNYPDIIEGLDFGGQTVYIYDWWSDGSRKAEPTEQEQLQYDYWDWLEKTYNVKIVETALSSWSENPTELANKVANQDDSELCVIGIAGDFTGNPLATNLFMPWTYGLDSGSFCSTVTDYMTKDGVCYGVSMGNAVEPRQGVFFNKQVLAEAGIDWNDLYDAQAEGTWTWDKMEEYMNKVQRDTDSDGVPDIWALTGNGDDITISMVVSNGADFYQFDKEGNLVPAIDDAKMEEALERRIAWGENYLRPAENWNSYMNYWQEGNVAFMIGQAYEGFTGTGTVNQLDGEWGFVMLPKGPEADGYTSSADDNVFGIPNVYDEETSLKLQQIYTLWNMQAPGTDEDAWADALYSLTDERAVEETYAMMREGKHATMMRFTLVGDRNSSITEITWNLGGGTAEEIIQEALPAFEERCNEYNELSRMQKVPSVVLKQAGYREVFTEETENLYYVLRLDEGAQMTLVNIQPGIYDEYKCEVKGGIQLQDSTVYGVKTGKGKILLSCANAGAEKPEISIVLNIVVIDPENTIIIPGSASKLDESAFQGTNAECVIIPEGMALVGKDCFANCPTLKTVIFAGDPAEAGASSAFESVSSILFLSGSGAMPQGLNPADTGITSFTGF